MIVHLPPPGDVYDGAAIRVLLAAVVRAFDHCASSQQTVSQILLQSPGGLTFALHVNDAGALQVTSIANAQGRL